MNRPSIAQNDISTEGRAAGHDAERDAGRDASTKREKELPREEGSGQAAGGKRELSRDISMWLAFPYCLIAVLISMAPTLDANRAMCFRFNFGDRAMAATTSSPTSGGAVTAAVHATDAGRAPLARPASDRKPGARARVADGSEGNAAARGNHDNVQNGAADVASVPDGGGESPIGGARPATISTAPEIDNAGPGTISPETEEVPTVDGPGPRSRSFSDPAPAHD